MIERIRATYEACKLVAQSIRLPEPRLLCDICEQRFTADELSVCGDARVCIECDRCERCGGKTEQLRETSLGYLCDDCECDTEREREQDDADTWAEMRIGE